MLFKKPLIKLRKKSQGISISTYRILPLLLSVFALLTVFSLSPLFAVTNNGVNQSPDKSIQNQESSASSIEDRFEKIEKTLQSIKFTGEKAEDRSYFNKMVSQEVVRYLKVMVVLLVLIALGFPLAIWILNRSSFGGSSGGSGDLAETLLTIEERQTKLANILKEIQGEIDYLHTMSAPDLKNLIQQAENYLKLNEGDLQKASSTSKEKKPK